MDWLSSLEPSETRLIILLITVAVGVAGWLYNNYSANRREIRKEQWLILDAINDKLELLKSTAINHHTADEFSLKTATEVNSIVGKIALRAALVSFIDNNTVAEHVSNIRRFTTEFNMDSRESFKSLKKDDRRITTIVHACDAFSNILEQRFVQRYHYGIGRAWEVITNYSKTGFSTSYSFLSGLFRK